jgi:pSer/pThr/pTyr-binding forkhead associated (FHA) protein
MKTYSIGRDLNCDIVLNDATDVISRRHALLNVLPSGKMTIVDQSSNGTYVNGIRISQNVPVPITRKDTISFAHVAKLDWNQVPKSNQWMKYAIIGFAALVVVVCIVFGIKYLNSGSDDDSDITPTEITDSVANAQKVALDDSIKKAQQDSIAEAAKQDSIKKAESEKQKADKPSKKKADKKAAEPKQQKQEENKSDAPKEESNKVRRVAG